MNKVLVERSRIKGRDSKGRAANKNIEDLPKKESMKKRHTDRKTLNENLNPLKRFLKSKVGQKWDKVYSEISENLKTSNAVQQHVRDHIWDFVHRNVEVYENGVIKSLRKYVGKFYELRNGDLYICPTSGLLKKYKVEKIKKESNYWNSVFAYKIAFISGHKSKVFINEDGDVYKVFQNKDSGLWDIVVPANSTHAKQDYKERWGTFNQDSILSFFKIYGSALNEKAPYFKKYLDLIESSPKKQKELPSVPSPFQVGALVEVSTDNGKTWKEGSINRMENNVKEKPTYWVSVATVNVMVSPYARRSQIRLKKP